MLGLGLFFMVKIITRDELVALLGQHPIEKRIIAEIKELDLHAQPNEAQVVAFLSFRASILSRGQLFAPVQSDPLIDRDEFLPMIILEDGLLVVQLGKRRSYVEGLEVAGSSKEIYDALAIDSDGRVRHAIELVPRENIASNYTVEVAEQLLVDEYNKCRRFQGHPNIVESYSIYSKRMGDGSERFVHLQRAYEGAITRLFYNTLELAIVDRGQKFLKDYVSIFYGYTKGLMEIHKVGVHGDVSPLNIFYFRTSHGFYQGVVGDLEGFCKGEVGDKIFSAALSEFVAPEVKNQVTRASDIYSLGATIMAIRDRFIYQVVSKMVKDSSRHIEVADKFNQEVFAPLGICDLIEAMMQADPRDRRSIHDVHTAFKDMMDMLEVPTNI